MKAWRLKTAHLSILLHTGSGDPFALRLHLRKTLSLLLLLSTTLLVLSVGTLLFFRELEVNRKLRESLLEVSLQERILKESLARHQKPENRSLVAQSPGATVESAATPAARVISTEPKTGSATPATSSVRARVAEVGTECAAGRCSVRLVIVPTVSATVEGSLLVILETEIPRIGTARATSSLQKRFFIYPGYQSKDELDLKEVNRLEGRHFKMSRALNTSVDFQHGELLRPLAVNVFIFDDEKNLIHHERRAIESAEE